VKCRGPGFLCIDFVRKIIPGSLYDPAKESRANTATKMKQRKKWWAREVGERRKEREKGRQKRGKNANRYNTL
jgi:hypothetical protein